MDRSPLVVDYESCDFRQFWDSPSKRILHSAEVRIISELLPPESVWFVDVGAGYGRLLPAYRGAARRIVLVDFSLKHLQMAEQEIDDTNVELVAANAYHLPFRDAAFDAGVCVRLLHHLDQLETFANELSRVFAPGGRVVVSFMNKRNLLRLLRYGPSGFRHNHSLIDRDTYGTHPVHFQRVFTTAGFAAGRRKGAGFLHQIAASAPGVDRAIGRCRLAGEIGIRLEGSLGLSLGSFNLALMQYVALRRDSLQQRRLGGEEELEDLLACPTCGTPDLDCTSAECRCPSCNARFERIGRIWDFRRL